MTSRGGSRLSAALKLGALAVTVAGALATSLAVASAGLWWWLTHLA